MQTSLLRSWILERRIYSEKHQGVLIIKNFYEVVLKTIVSKELSKVYKKALETENDRKWIENSITASGETTTEIRSVWGGYYANVDTTEIGEDKTVLILTLVSRTLPNLKETVRSYELGGTETIHTSY